jgi:hypothetical protein
MAVCRAGVSHPGPGAMRDLDEPRERSAAQSKHPDQFEKIVVILSRGKIEE